MRGNPGGRLLDGSLIDKSKSCPEKAIEIGMKEMSASAGKMRMMIQYDGRCTKESARCDDVEINSVDHVNWAEYQLLYFVRNLA